MNINLSGVFCTGNNHVRITATGGKTGQMDFEVAELRTYQPTAEDLWSCARTLLALGAQGKTPGQAKAWLVAGVDVTVTP